MPAREYRADAMRGRPRVAAQPDRRACLPRQRSAHRARSRATAHRHESCSERRAHLLKRPYMARAQACVARPMLAERPASLDCPARCECARTQSCYAKDARGAGRSPSRGAYDGSKCVEARKIATVRGTVMRIMQAARWCGAVRPQSSRRAAVAARRAFMQSRRLRHACRKRAARRVAAALRSAGSSRYVDRYRRPSWMPSSPHAQEYSLHDRKAFARQAAGKMQCAL